jgi:arylsulfatase A-like enzyme
MTGRYAFRTGIASITDPPPPAVPSSLPDAEKFLPELLKSGVAGTPYACGAFGKWHLTTATGDDAHPIDNGFDVFRGFMSNPLPPSNHYVFRKTVAVRGSPVAYEGINGSVHPVTHEFTPSASPVYDVDHWSANIATNDATAWINAQSAPFFAYVAYAPPHGPHQVPPHERLSAATAAQLSDVANCQGPYLPGMLEVNFDEEDAVLERVFYRATLEAVDTEIGRLIDGIDPAKRANTMIFVIGDNGTAFPVLDQTHNTGHGKGTVYEWGTHVPFVACGPLVPKLPSLAHECSGLVDAVDLWRTIAEVAGASVTLAQPITPIDGKSFYPMLRNPSAQSARQYSFAQFFTPSGPYTPTAAGPYDPGPPACQPPPPANSCEMVELNAHARSITDGTYRYVRKQIQRGIDGSPQGTPDTPPVYTEELYDVAADPEELSNLIPPLPQQPSPEVLAILNELRDAMLSLSGY